jgi:hypothetical protein
MREDKHMRPNHALDNRTVRRCVGCVPNAATSMFPDRVVRFANRGHDTARRLAIAVAIGAPRGRNV